VWNADVAFDRKEEEILGDLAYDLDFYEPDAVKRSEDESFYGDERLEEILSEALKRLDA
jgi:hypothetical protein